MRDRYPVAVVGAGPAGAACATALARAGVGPVVLVDAGRPAVAVGETIPPDTRLLLDRLGLLEAFLQEGHAPCLGSASAWGSETLGHNDFLLNPQGTGWHLDRARFDAFLRRGAVEAGAILLDETGLVGVEEDRSGYRLRLQDRGGASSSLTASFVVDASGRSSAFARRVGAQRLSLDRLTFVYGYFDTSDAASHSRLTLLEAVRDGWWYAAGRPAARLAVAFAGDAEHVRASCLGREDRWLGALLATRHVAARLDGCRFLAGSVVPRVAAGFLLEPAAGPRWLAVGDAAACYDPLSGQGIYKAIADGLEAAGLIAEALARGGRLPEGHQATLRERFDEYLVNRNHFYGLERRWPNAAFWQRRQARSDLRAAA